MKLAAVIHSDPEFLGGTLMFVGTRVPVQSLLDHLEAGDSIDDFLEGFPSMKREQVNCGAGRVSQGTVDLQDSKPFARSRAPA